MLAIGKAFHQSLHASAGPIFQQGLDIALQAFGEHLCSPLQFPALIATLQADLVSGEEQGDQGHTQHEADDEAQAQSQV